MRIIINKLLKEQLIPKTTIQNLFGKYVNEISKEGRKFGSTFVTSKKMA
jgi:hypothetical protein